MSGERRVTQPLVARKKDGGRLDLILIDRGRTIQVVGGEPSGRILLTYKGARFVAHESDIGSRTSPVVEDRAGALSLPA